MNKKLIRLTESDLHRIVKESVRRIIREHYRDYPRNDEQLEMVMDKAKLFLRDYTGGYYKDYIGPALSFSGDDSVDGRLRFAEDLYRELKYQNCMDTKLLRAIEGYIKYYGA